MFYLCSHTLEYLWIHVCFTMHFITIILLPLMISLYYPNLNNKTCKIRRNETNHRRGHQKRWNLYLADPHQQRLSSRDLNGTETPLLQEQHEITVFNIMSSMHCVPESELHCNDHGLSLTTQLSNTNPPVWDHTPSGSTKASPAYVKSILASSTQTSSNSWL